MAAILCLGAACRRQAEGDRIRGALATGAYTPAQADTAITLRDAAIRQRQGADSQALPKTWALEAKRLRDLARRERAAGENGPAQALEEQARRADSLARGDTGRPVR